MVVKIKKPKAIIMDVTGTIATRAFMSYSQESKQFMKQNLREYVIESWGKRELRLAINFFRTEQDQEMAKLNQESTNKPVPKSRYQFSHIDGKEGKEGKDNSLEKSKEPLLADSKATIEEQAEALISNVLWRLNDPKKNKSPALSIFHLHMNEWGYKKGIIKTPVYEDSAVTLKKWKQKDNIKIFITLGTLNFLQLALANTTSGDLYELIAGNFNLMVGNRKNFTNVSEHVKEPISKILYITRIPFDARIAQSSNIQTVIIIREDFDPDAIMILKKIEKKRRQKARERSASLKEEQILEEQQTTEQARDQKPSSTKAVPVQSTVLVAEENELSSASKITPRDIRDFPVIQRLDELVWE